MNNEKSPGISLSPEEIRATLAQPRAKVMSDASEKLNIVAVEYEFANRNKEISYLIVPDAVKARHLVYLDDVRALLGPTHDEMIAAAPPGEQA